MDQKADVTAYMQSIKEYTDAKSIWEKADAEYNEGTLPVEAWLKAKIIWHEAELCWWKTEVAWNKTNAALHNAKIGPAREAEVKSLLLLSVTKTKLKETQENSTGTNRQFKQLPQNAETEREWTIRDDNKQHHHGSIPADQNVITMTLNWKENAEGTAQLVGKYCFNLHLLLDSCYVRTDIKGIRLRFQRTGHNIEIAISRESPALSIGKIVTATD